MALGMEVGLIGPGHIVLHGDSAPSPKRERRPRPQFVPFSSVAKRLDAFKMPLGTEVGISAGNFVLDGDTAGLSNFRPMSNCGQTAGWIKMVLGMDLGLAPATLCKMGTQPLPKKGTELSQLSAHFYCGRRLDASRCHLVWR